MILSEYAHCFEPVENSSIELIKMRCFNDFFKNIKLFVGKGLDEQECSIKNYDRFDYFCGNHINYNNKNLQFETTIPREQSSELFYTMCENKKETPKECVCGVKSTQEEIEEKGLELLNEPVEYGLFDGQAKGVTTRSRALFGVGEFPFLILKIARIGNQDYFWYILSR